jgi:hypothetical protein
MLPTLEKRLICETRIKKFGQKELKCEINNAVFHKNPAFHQNWNILDWGKKGLHTEF